MANMIDDNTVNEILATGTINVFSQGALLLLTFTHARPPTAVLFSENPGIIENDLHVVARIAIPIENAGGLAEAIKRTIAQASSVAGHA
jgi:hypothetical protein